MGYQALMTPSVEIAIPPPTLEWLTAPDNPAVAVLTRRDLLGEPSGPGMAALWEVRNTYGPVSQILELMSEDGSWDVPRRDYKKYEGSLWQIHFLGELYADGKDERIQRAAEYAFGRQLSDGSWSCSNGRPRGSIPCLTANVGRALARMGFSRDARIVEALRYIVSTWVERGSLGCVVGASDYTLNGYCHMLAPKVLLFLSVVPSELWPDGAVGLRDAAVQALREREIFRSLPHGSREFQEAAFKLDADELGEYRKKWMGEHGDLVYRDKPGWLRFGYPLSYNSDALEALFALAAVDETWRPEYQPAIDTIRAAADDEMRWSLRNSFNGKMLADVETKGQPSRWLTLRALKALRKMAQ